MKKTVVAVAAMLAITMLCCLLTSCSGTLSGTYSDSLGITSYTFRGGKVTYKATILGTVVSREGEYTLDEKAGEIKFTFEGDSTVSGTYTFSRDKENGTVTIGLVTYTKQ